MQLKRLKIWWWAIHSPCRIRKWLGKREYSKKDKDYFFEALCSINSPSISPWGVYSWCFIKSKDPSSRFFGVPPRKLYEKVFKSINKAQ